MDKKKLIILALSLLVVLGLAAAQYTPWLYWTLLPKNEIDEIVGEASGETALNTIIDINGYNRDRMSEEYAGPFLETQVILKKLKQYGLAGAEIVSYPGGETWDGVKGELWEVTPRHQKLASMRDMVPMLASGSSTTDVTGELVWVGRGTTAEIEAAKVEGKIVVTEGSLGAVHNLACLQKGALGVIGISMSRPYFDPLQMGWAGIASFRGMRGGPGQPAQAAQPQTPPPAPPKPKFGFQLPVREGDILKQRLMASEKITARAQVESKQEKYKMENVVAYIPGTDPTAGEVIFSAHLFEGMTKLGANDNTSGSATILEAGRLLNTLIQEGRLPKPKRTIRFLWGPEFSGTSLWVKANKPIMDKTLCNINMDMVGEWLSKNQAFMCLMRTTYGNPHYINDVVENLYRYVGEGNRERIQNRSGFNKVPVRVVAPFGADEPFYYSIETHYGASDHEVFNDWGVQVPGVMMIAWPDRWYHTSGDLPDKSDATQLKRAAAIGAAGAYTVANADDNMAIKIAGETASNATRRIGHQFVVALEILNGAKAETLADSYKSARTYVEGAVLNEKDTLDSILELAMDKGAVGNYIGQMKKTVDAVGNANLAALQAHMEATARRLGQKPVVIALTDLEKKAVKIIPKPTAKITEGGYQGYRKYIDGVPAAEKAKYPYASEVSSTGELQLLINGKHNVLDIMKLMDAQAQRRSTVQGILNYLQILKLAGLVEM
ncbi:MAG: M28 family peptidase [Candidatus Aminicenantes bacterium]|nr:M28 family peptidase [Candidatus Aminicenantes bacterium]